MGHGEDCRGVVNRAYHRMLKITPEEAWVASPGKRQEMLRHQQLERERRNVVRGVEKREENYQVEDLPGLPTRKGSEEDAAQIAFSLDCPVQVIGAIISSHLARDVGEWENAYHSRGRAETLSIGLLVDWKEKWVLGYGEKKRSKGVEDTSLDAIGEPYM